jgi:hypothetical protein
MALITSSTVMERDKVINAVETIRGASTFEEVGQQCVDTLYEAYSESIVLARLFTTVPYGNLPNSNKQFVDSLAKSVGIVPLMTDRTPVLSLIGTRGQRPEWNNRRQSQGHVGIPLASGAFISSIPMMSRLLKQLGLDLAWIDEWDTKIVAEQNLSKFSGMFYVQDARTEFDKQGRNVIAAQDFVEEFGVRTVFGFGGGYLQAETFVVLIVFTRETIQQEIVQPFTTVINAFKIATLENGLKSEVFVDLAA